MTPLAAVLAATLLAPAPWCERGAVDLHVDVPFQVHYRGRDADLALAGSDVTQAAMRRGCVRTLVLSLFVPHRMKHRDLDALLEVLETAEAIDTGDADTVFSVEGAGPLVGSLDAIPGLVARGVRVFGIVHIRHNALASSSSDPHPRAGGLTEAGREFVHAVYDAGALVDVSHASDRSFDDIAAIAKARRRPLVATHSNARAIATHRRNLTDEQLRTIAATGGVVGLAFHAPFLNDAWRDASVVDFALHAVHMVEVMGAAHVALGSDLDGLIHHGKALRSHAALPGIALRLRAEGLTPAQVTQILGSSARRVLATAKKN